ncbi:hypothetical protein ACWDWO_03660 [Actinopolymorpha singaporensis]
MNHQTEPTERAERAERCGLCLGFGGHRLLGPCPACQPADFDAYLATLATTTSHREEDRP